MKYSVFLSSVFRKIWMAVTGLALVGFLITHLAGNLLLYKSDGSVFNEYAYRLESLGPLLWIAEIGLLFFFGYHAYTGICLAISAKKAKPKGYQHQRSKGGGSKWTLASTNMVLSGSALLIFLILHVLHFKYGPSRAEGYVSQISSGVEVRDLHRHVFEQFQKPWVVILYVAAMLFLGLHLRHGIWSAFQSLGWLKGGVSKKVYLVGGVLAGVLGLGFLLIPLFLYFSNKF